jgi:uncharacterized protein YndB with AHSA1/START domain
MSAYLFTFRAPAGYVPTPGTFDTFASWQLELGARLKDRGNAGFAAAALGASAAGTTLGGYSVIRATSLDAAIELAQGCPILQHGGTVEIAELANHDDRFDQWLDRRTNMTGTFAAEVSLHIPAAPADVFCYFTDPARYPEWMGSKATLDPVPGGTYEVSMADGFRAAGTFRELDPPHQLTFTWGFADEEAAQRTKHQPADPTADSANSAGNALPAGSTRVTVTLDPEDGGTRLNLRHEDLPSAELQNAHQVAWETYLPRLVIRAAGGDPGPDPHS